MSIRPLERFLALSIGIHLLFFLLSGFYLPAPRSSPERPLMVEVLPLPQPKVVVPPKEPRVLSDVNRRAEKETRQREVAREGRSEKGSPQAGATIKPAPAVPSPRPEPREQAPAPPLQERREVARAVPPSMPVPRAEEATPPKSQKESQAKISLPQVQEKAETPAMKEARESQNIARLPSAPQALQAPSLAQEIAPALKEGKGKETAPSAIPPLAALPPPQELPKQRPLPSVRELIPSPESLARLPSLGREGTNAPAAKEETVSLNTQEFKYYSYFVKLKRLIESVWDYPLEARAQGQQGTLFMEFTISKNGNLEDIKLMRSSRYSILDDEAMRAVRVALGNPLPLPEGWGLDRLNVRASFTYQLSFWTVQ